MIHWPQCGAHYIPQGNFAFWKLPQGKISLSQDKSLPAWWVYWDLHQQYCWHKSTWTSENGLSLGRGVGLVILWEREKGSNTVSMAHSSDMLCDNPLILISCLSAPWRALGVHRNRMSFSVRFNCLQLHIPLHLVPFSIYPLQKWIYLIWFCSIFTRI